MMSVFLDGMAERLGGRRCILVMDRAGWHASGDLEAPPNIRIVLPPYSPELNPVERLWQRPKLRARSRKRPKRCAVLNRLHPALESVMESVETCLKTTTAAFSGASADAIIYCNRDVKWYQLSQLQNHGFRLRPSTLGACVSAPSTSPSAQSASGFVLGRSVRCAETHARCVRCAETHARCLPTPLGCKTAFCNWLSCQRGPRFRMLFDGAAIFF
jgi:hypothetical protein